MQCSSFASRPAGIALKPACRAIQTNHKPAFLSFESIPERCSRPTFLCSELSLCSICRSTGARYIASFFLCAALHRIRNSGNVGGHASPLLTQAMNPFSVHRLSNRPSLSPKCCHGRPLQMSWTICDRKSESCVTRIGQSPAPVAARFAALWSPAILTLSTALRLLLFSPLPPPFFSGNNPVQPLLIA